MFFTLTYVRVFYLSLQANQPRKRMSESKLRKTDKKLHPMRGGSFLKMKTKLKRIGFYNSAIRNQLKREMNYE